MDRVCICLYLYLHRDYIWNFPVSIFEAFVETFVLTYLFNGSLLKYFFDYHILEYTLKSVQDGELIRYAGIGNTMQIKNL